MIADGSVEVLIIAPISDAALHTVQAVDAAVRVVDGRQMFEAEYRRSWPPATARRYLPAKAGPREALPQAERDRLLATAEVALGTFPFPKDLRSRPRVFVGFTSSRRGRAICATAICGEATSR